MTANALSFPYPVLGNADDLEGSFGWDASVKLGRDEIVITAILKLENGDLKRAISDGSASFVIQIQCPVTYYRESFSTTNQKVVIKIPAQRLRDSVEMTPFITSIKELKTFSPRSAHSDYKAKKFSVDDGSILAFGPKAFFIADKEFVGSKRRLRSIMEFVRSPREGAEPEYRLGGNRIEIHLNANDWSVYQAAKASGDARNIIHASVVFPVLLEALGQMDADDYIGLPWRERLKVLIHEKGLDDATDFKKAMALLKNPISRGFAGLGGFLTQEGAGDEEDE